MSPRPAIVEMLDGLVDERRGELRRLDLLAQGIELDLDQAGLQSLGRAPDHDDILAQLRIPDQLLAPLWEDWRESRVLFTVGMPAAVAGYGEVTGQAIIARARAEADRVRALLVELARLKIMGQVPTDEEFLALLDPADRPMVEGLLERMAWYEQALDQLQNPAHNPAPGNGQGSQMAPEAETTESPNIRGSGKKDSTGAGQPGSYVDEQDRSDVRNTTNDQIRAREDDDWSPM
jgi:hypothetical protein